MIIEYIKINNYFLNKKLLIKYKISNDEKD